MKIRPYDPPKTRFTIFNAHRMINYKALLACWPFLVALCIGPAGLHAQSSKDVAFSVGSYDKKTEEVRTFGANDIVWIIDDMDDGTSVIVIKGSYGLSVSKEHGIVFITSVNIKDESASLMLIGSLPIKIPSLDPGSTVQFTCDRGKFIYLYKRTR